MKKFYTLAKRVRDSVSGVADLRDAHAYGGLAMVGYGIYTYTPGAAFIVCGTVLFWIGIRR